MSRTRIWLISTATVLCTAVPALAYSWPALFGVPGAFGQESSRPPQTAGSPSRAASASARPAAVVASASSSQTEGGAEACEGPCEHLNDCLSAWQRLWTRGEYAKALGLAHSAAQAAPRNLAAQHAFVLSQIMNEPRVRPIEGGFEEAEACPSRCATGQPGVCPASLGVMLPLQMPLLPPGVHVISDDHLQRFVSQCVTECSTSGSCAKSCHTACCDAACAADAKGCCEKCAKECKCCCTKMQKNKSERTASLPTTIVIVREAMPMQAMPMHIQMPVQMAMPHVVPLPPPPVVPAFSYAPVFDAPVVGRPAPAVLQAELDETRYQARDEECVAASSAPNIRILQRGGMCFVSSPNYEIRCDRVQGGNGDRLVLEGNVTLVSRRHGQTMTIEAERVTLNVASDQFQIDNARGLEQTRFNVAPVAAPAPSHAPTPVPTGYYVPASER